MAGRLDRISALRAERTALLTVCEQLSDAQWLTPSAAVGWNVQDVVAHIGSGCHAMFSTSALKMLLSTNIESTNDDFVALRRTSSPGEVLDEYRCWSNRVVTLAAVVSRTPLAGVPLPLAELGRFRASLLLGGALVFDHHTHLRHDLLPAIGATDPGTDANRMGVVTEWMMAVLGNQLRSAKPPWLERPIAMTLRGAGGGTWVLDAYGAHCPAGLEVVAWIEADVNEFPEWGTRRCGWRDRDVTIGGDETLCTMFLDELNVV